MYFKKKKHKKRKGFTIDGYKKSPISYKQMKEITNSVLNKKRLFVYADCFI